MKESFKPVTLVLLYGMAMAGVLIGINVHYDTYRELWSTSVLIAVMIITQITFVALAQRNIRPLIGSSWIKLSLAGWMTFMISELIFQVYESISGEGVNIANIFSAWVMWGVYFSPVPMITAVILVKYFGAKNGKL